MVYAKGISLSLNGQYPTGGHTKGNLFGVTTGMRLRRWFTHGGNSLGGGTGVMGLFTRMMKRCVLVRFQYVRGFAGHNFKKRSEGYAN